LQNRLANLASDEAFSYDKTAAVKGVIGVNNSSSGAYNCGTYVQEVL
jgi:hypothetical protein